MQKEERALPVLFPNGKALGRSRVDGRRFSAYSDGILRRKLWGNRYVDQENRWEYSLHLVFFVL